MIRGSTKICMILGHPLKHTRSPLMHNAAFADLGLDYVYIPVEVKPEGVSAIIRALRATENFGGANITVPHKVQVMGCLDGWSPEADSIGAVNTLYKKGEQLWGENTDGRGFVASLREEAEFEPKGKRVMILGAGGAARAVTQALVRDGAERVYLVNRTLRKAEEVASFFGGKSGSSCLVPIGFGDPLFGARLQECHLLVNSTSVGLSRNDSPLFDYRLLPSTLLVYDLIYDPELTPLLRTAQERGCSTFNGLGMLVYQGAFSFEIWTQRPPPVEKMREAVKAIV